MSNITELFGSMVFNEQVMKERLPKETFKTASAHNEKRQKVWILI